MKNGILRLDCQICSSDQFVEKNQIYVPCRASISAPYFYMNNAKIEFPGTNILFCVAQCLKRICHTATGYYGALVMRELINQ